MGSSAHAGERRLSGTETANARLKAGARGRLHRSVVASVAIHAAAIFGLPELTLPTLSARRAPTHGGLRVVTLGATRTAEPSAAPLPPRIVPVEEAEREEPASAVAGEEASLRDAAPAGWGSRGEELWRLAGLRARFVEPVPRREERTDTSEATDVSASDGEDEDGLRIRRESSDLEYERLTEEERVSLERLSALRPELVLSSPSSWLLVRNSEEVGRFWRGRFDRHDPDARIHGALSVSLWVDEDGTVDWAEIHRSSGDPDVDALALELFRDVARFRPAREGGLRVPIAAIFSLAW